MQAAQGLNRRRSRPLHQVEDIHLHRLNAAGQQVLRIHRDEQIGTDLVVQLLEPIVDDFHFPASYKNILLSTALLAASSLLMMPRETSDSRA